MTENSLAIYSQIDQIQKAADYLLQSGYFKDVTSRSQAMVKVMAGAEMGVGPWASMTGINIIQGKPTMAANLIATLVKNDPRYDYQVKQCTGTVCDLTWFENGRQVGTSSFTFEEAKTAGLTDKDNWRKYPSDMLFARAISRGARRFAPGIFGGSAVYTPEEMGVEMNEEGMIESVATVVQPTQEYLDDLRKIENPLTKQGNGEMTLEQAKLVIGKNDGKAYWDCTNDELKGKKIGLKKMIKQDDLVHDLMPEARELVEYKLDAVNHILINDPTDSRHSTAA